ncbi:MAG: UDP-glucose--hexose-1-phosphate uridylyltransferase, partial [Streptococcaceae bacterium]|nr:UDP-glucose--hexose-1-phosphate uridylyltransferase [Streptococcaceae bacterium]
MTTYEMIDAFVNLAIENGTIAPLDAVYQRNQLMQFLGLTALEKSVSADKSAHRLTSLELKDNLLKLAADNGKLADDFYESALMDFITPKPSVINSQFWQKYEESPEKATDYFYELARTVNQVKTRDIAKNLAFRQPSKYGDLEITINLSKPEKDPKAIAAAKLIKTSSYPECALCMENEGFYGSENKAARSNHRIIRMSLGDENWGFQYSPYAYYNEHSIVLNAHHQPM